MVRSLHFLLHYQCHKHNRYSRRRLYTCATPIYRWLVAIKTSDFLTRRNTVVLQKLTVSQLFKTFSAFHETCWSISDHEPANETPSTAWSLQPTYFSNACSSNKINCTLDVIFLGIKTRSLTSSEEHRLRVFENTDLRNTRILGLSEKWGPRQLSRYSDSLRIGRSGDRIPVAARFSANVQTGPGAHPLTYTMSTGSFPGVKQPGRGVDHPSL